MYYKKGAETFVVDFLIGFREVTPSNTHLHVKIFEFIFTEKVRTFEHDQEDWREKIMYYIYSLETTSTDSLSSDFVN